MNDVHRKWEPDRLFWSLLEAPSWNGRLPSGLESAFESDVPLPMDQLHAVCAPAGEARLVVCAARIRDLESLDPAALSLIPEHVPESIGGACDPAHLNLLVGRYEPQVIRRTRVRSHVLAAMTVLACAGLFALGLARRTIRHDALTTAAHDAATRLAASAIPGGGPDQLALEVARARRGAAHATEARPAPDAALALGSLLSAWPALPAAPRTQSISIGPQGIAVELTVEGDAGAFMGAFHPPSGWLLDEPRLVRLENLTRLSLRLKRQESRP